MDRCECKSNSLWDIDNNKCECINGFTLNAATQNCEEIGLSGVGVIIGIFGGAVLAGVGVFLGMTKY